MPTGQAWYVYILRCADGTFYTGIARDVTSRISAHETGRGARYTAGRGPFELCAKRRCKSQGDALRLEFAIKQLSREQKTQLCKPRRLASFARATQQLVD
jgi:putative endonuclease